MAYFPVMPVDEDLTVYGLTLYVQDYLSITILPIQPVTLG